MVINFEDSYNEYDMGFISNKDESQEEKEHVSHVEEKIKNILEKVGEKIYFESLEA